MDLAAYLDQQLRAAGIPIVGVSLVSSGDRAGWIVQFDPSATDPQKASATTLLQSVVIDAATALDQDAQKAVATTVSKALCALMLEVKLNRTLTVADIPTVQAMFTKAQAYYKFIVQNGL